MRVIKNILRDIYLYILWALMAWLLIGFLFARVNDTSPRKKVSFFVDAAFDEIALRDRLEANRPQGIKMIKPYPFSYIIFDAGEMEGADFYIMPEKNLEEYKGRFEALDAFADLHPEYEYLEREGKKVGILVHKAGESGTAGLIQYENENYYVFFNNLSKHIRTLSGKGDDAAFEVLENLIKIK